jgi:arginyl-tRNA synthetase
LRYLELCGEQIAFPSNGYKGDYVFDIAATVHRQHANQFQHLAANIFADVPADASLSGEGDKEAHIDALIERAKTLLGETDYMIIFNAGLDTILADIKHDLSDFEVNYEQWFSERSLSEDNSVDEAIARLQALDMVYEKEGNLWFRSSAFGDEKDRVVVRKNGSKTYLASDIAYHMNKLDRGYDQLIDIWGADHHGYVARVKAAIEALGESPEKLEVLLVQFASLYRGEEKVQMSTRSGDFVTLRELRQEVGNDATRLFYVMRKCEQHMDFDLELAKSRSNENPVYYIQYAHARICSVIRQLQEKGLTYQQQQGLEHVAMLQEPHEQALLTQLSRYPEVLESAARSHEPHQLAHYSRDLANDLHSYYNAHQFIVDDDKLRDARLCLIMATKQVLVNVLNILAVSAPESM